MPNKNRLQFVSFSSHQSTCKIDSLHIEVIEYKFAPVNYKKK